LFFPFSLCVLFLFRLDFLHFLLPIRVLFG
jgi:hypothetical protein